MDEKELLKVPAYGAPGASPAEDGIDFVLPWRSPEPSYAAEGPYQQTRIHGQEHSMRHSSHALSTDRFRTMGDSSYRFIDLGSSQELSLSRDHFEHAARSLRSSVTFEEIQIDQHGIEPPTHKQTEAPEAGHPTSVHGKRKRTESGSGNDRKQHDRPIHKRPSGNGSFWACPFAKHDPVRYAEVHNKCTNRPGIQSMKKLREHLRKVHSTARCCTNCRKRFQNATELKTHQTKSSCITKRATRSDAEWMSSRQEAVFSVKITSDAPDEEKWHQYYEALWPDDPRRNNISPYYDYCTLNLQEAKSQASTLPATDDDVNGSVTRAHTWPSLSDNADYVGRNPGIDLNDLRQMGSLFDSEFVLENAGVSRSTQRLHFEGHPQQVEHGLWAAGSAPQNPWYLDETVHFDF